MQMDGNSIDSNSRNIVACHRKELFIQQGQGLVFQRVTIESLPEDVLLEIFDFYLPLPVELYSYENHFRDWKTLVHVCRRWRYVVFGSPIRLDLLVFCSRRTPVRKLLDVWPEFPLALEFYSDTKLEDSAFDNIVAALGHCDRIGQIEIWSPAAVLCNKFVTAMEEPFPALRSLSLRSSGVVVTLPDTFLNGSAPCLRNLTFSSISFPSLPRFLSSTSDLTSLDLFNIPNSGYIPPEIMAGILSALPKLKSLSIHFKSPGPQPERRNRPVPPPTRVFLPALVSLSFKGVSEYLEVLAARVDAHLFHRFSISFVHQHVFDIPQILRLFGHLKPFMLSSQKLIFNPSWAEISSSSSTGYYRMNSHSWLIDCERLDWQVLSLAQICSQILLFRSSVNSLTLESWLRLDPENMDPTLWLQLFHSFPSVQSLSIHVKMEPSIAAALQGLTGESVSEVFPLLHSLSVFGNRSEEATQQGIQSFIAARQHSGHPVALFRQK